MGRIVLGALLVAWSILAAVGGESDITRYVIVALVLLLPGCLLIWWGVRARPTALFGPPDVARLEAKGDAEGLMKALGYQKDRSVGQAAAKALARIGAAPEPLIAALDDRIEVRSGNAWLALVELGSPAVPAAAAALRSSTPEVRRIAARILGEIGDPQAVVPLIAAIQDQDHYVRDAAAASLAAFSPHLLMVGLKGQNEDVRRVAAEAIAKHDMDIASERAFVAGVRAREAAAEAEAKFVRTPCDIRFHEWRAHGPWGHHLECQRCGVLLHLESGVLFASKKDGSAANIGRMELTDGKWRPAE